MAREAKVFINAVTGEARSSVQDLEEDLRDLEDAADKADRSTSSVGGADAAASMQTAGTAADQAADDMSQLARRYGLVGRAAEAAGGDVRQVGRVFDQLDKKTVAVIGSIGLLTGAFAAAGGLAAAATAVAAKLGPQGLQRDIKNVQGRAKDAANTFAQEFEPVIRGQVLPVIRELINRLEEGSDEFATFTRFMLTSLTSAADATEGGAGAAQDNLLASLLRPVESAGNLAGADITGPSGFLLSLFESPDTTSQQQRTTDQIDRAKQKLRKLNNTREQAVGVARNLQEAGVDRTKVLQRIIDANVTARDKAAKLNQKLDNVDISGFVRRRQREIELLRRRLSILKKTEKILSRIRATPADPRRAPAAGRLRSGSPLSGGPGGTVQGTAQQAREMQRTASQLEESISNANQSSKEFLKFTSQNLTSIIGQASRLGTTLVRAFEQGKLEAQDFVSVLAQVLGTALSITGNPQAGQAVSSLGNFVSSFQHGGVVDTPLQIVGEKGPELAALPERTRIFDADTTSRIMQSAMQPPEPREININLSVNEPDLFRLESAIREEREFKDTYIRD